MRIDVTSAPVCGQLDDGPPVVGTADGSIICAAVIGHHGVEPAAKLFAMASGSGSRLVAVVFVAKNCALADCVDTLANATVPEKSEAGTRLSPS